MSMRAIPAVSARLRELALIGLALAGASGCLAGAPELGGEDAFGADPEVASAEQPLRRGAFSPRLGYTCTNGVCECDKSIENDCEDMSAECTDDTVDALINCINGWLTTHCSCTQAKLAPTSPVRTATVYSGSLLLNAR